MSFARRLMYFDGLAGLISGLTGLFVVGLGLREKRNRDRLTTE